MKITFLFFSSDFVTTFLPVCFNIYLVNYLLNKEITIKNILLHATAVSLIITFIALFVHTNNYITIESTLKMSLVTFFACLTLHYLHLKKITLALIGANLLTFFCIESAARILDIFSNNNSLSFSGLYYISWQPLFCSMPLSCLPKRLNYPTFSINTSPLE